MNKKKGVSLIVLVITIIMMLIIAGVVVLQMQDTNHITQANLAKTVTDVKTYQMNLESNLLELKTKDKDIDIYAVNAKGEAVLTYIPDMKAEYIGKIYIENSELYLVKGAFKLSVVEELKGVGINEK